MTMTAAQQRTADAYRHVFAPGVQLQIVFDDLVVQASAIADPSVRCGFNDAVNYIQRKASALRREKARG